MPKRAQPTEWWKNYFDAQYLLEYEPLLSLEQDRVEVSRLLEVLGLPSGSKVLDVPCGQGRHAHLLAEAGFDVIGLDYSVDLLARARARGTGPRLRYRRGDMRRLPSQWRGRFDAVVNLFTSFGFFAHPRDDRDVIREFARVLRPGGALIWHGASRDGVMARFLGRDWWTTRNRTLVAQERTFDPLSGQLTVESVWRGPRGMGSREHRIRLYSPTHLAELCAEVGLVVEQAYAGFTDKRLSRTSSEMMLVAHRSNPLPGSRRSR